MKIVMDCGRCTGIGVCESIAPEHFEVNDDGTLQVLDENVGEDDRDTVEEAVQSCPARALALEER
jgi:ferredoxin